jgi:hypothetical protein
MAYMKTVDDKLIMCDGLPDAVMTVNQLYCRRCLWTVGHILAPAANVRYKIISKLLKPTDSCHRL